MANRTATFETRFPTDAPNQWTVEEGDFKTGFRLSNPKMSVSVEYGCVRKSNGQISHCQPQIENPGGAVIVPFIRILTDDGKIDRVKVGIDLAGERPIADDFFVELVRGFSDPTKTGFESPRKTAAREFSESDEAYVKLPEDRFAFLGGPFNMDSTWFLHPQGRGVFVYSCEVWSHELALVGGRVTFKPGVTTHNKLSKVEFVDIDMIQTECGMTQLGVEMLKSFLGYR